MKEDLKSKVFTLKNKGLSYSKIAKNTELSINTIKSLFRRQDSKDKGTHLVCKNCGRKMNELSGGRVKKFCSDSCRFKWWNKNALKSRKHLKILICKNCGEKFKSYDNKARQYCCHQCYITRRFKNNKECIF